MATRVKKNLGEVQADLFRYLNMEGAKKTLESGMFKFSRAREFNDPFDCNPNTITFQDCDSLRISLRAAFAATNVHGQAAEAIIESMLQSPVRMKELKDGFIEEKMRGVAILCFSKVRDSIPMWAYYASNHSGVCLHFDFSVGENIVDDIMLLNNVTYSNSKVNFYQDKRAAFAHLWSTKSEQWQHEQEVRIAIHTKENNPIILRRFNPAFLKTVIFGMRMTAEQKKELFQIILSKGYECNIEEAIPDGFKVGFRRAAL